MKNVYIAELDRFGYMLTVAETTEKKARAAIISAYIKTFESINGFHPDDEESDRSADGRTWLQDAEEVDTERNELADEIDRLNVKVRVLKDEYARKYGEER